MFTKMRCVANVDFSTQKCSNTSAACNLRNASVCASLFLDGRHQPVRCKADPLILSLRKCVAGRSCIP